MRRLTLLLVVAVLLTASSLSAAPIPSPETFLGHRVGADRYLAPWPTIVEYMHTVADLSDRISVESAGTSTLGNDMMVVVVTSAANQAALDRYREIARRLANADTLDPAEADELIAEGKAIVLVTGTIHSTEVGAAQMSMEFVHEMATTEDPEVLGWLDDVILLLMPSINPDGQIMVVDWYNRWLGTEYEGARMPWLYHHYVGHDDNRDFFMLTQKETRAVNDLLYHRWFPQVFLDEHQMGSTGPRIFVPPQTDPLAPEVSSLVFAQADLLGTAMALRLEEAGKTGVGSNMIFDSYWPGGTRNTAWWKNVVGLLSETASVDVATPIFIEPNELSGASKGLPDYQRRANFISPWPGGWWRLRDIIDYELVITRSIVESAARYREGFLRNVYRMARTAAERGGTEPPYAFLVPPDQHDPVAAAELVNLMQLHGVRTRVADAPLQLGPTTYPAGTVVIPAAQPYREFLLTMLRPQRYPEVTPYRDGPILPPYDATTWSLPIAMGVDVVEATAPLPADGVRPADAPVWSANVSGTGSGGWIVDHAADTAPTLMNRLLAEHADLFWLRDSQDGGAPGAIYLPPGTVSRARAEELAGDLHLSFRGVDTPPEGSAYRVRPVRIGMYQPWTASMDEGWNRYLLERYEFPYKTLHNEDVTSGSFADGIDVLILPDLRPASIVGGVSASRYGSSPMPPKYAGGLGSDGGAKLSEWIRKGGTVVAINDSTGYLIDLLDLPARNVLEGVSRDAFSCPGSALRILVDTDNPLAYGMRAEDVAYFDNSPAFRTRIPDARFTRRVVARYPDDRRDLLVSGFLKGEQYLARTAAVVEIGVGEGRVVLIGFKPQQRAQTHRTFKLFFNALYLPGLEETELK